MAGPFYVQRILCSRFLRGQGRRESIVAMYDAVAVVRRLMLSSGALGRFNFFLPDPPLSPLESYQSIVWGGLGIPAVSAILI